MYCRCPNCGASYSLDALIGFEAEHEAARLALKRVFALGGELGRAILQYIGLFRPEQRELSMKRLATLLGELLPDIERGRIDRHGRSWAAPVPAWVAAMTHMADNRHALRLPLKGHGYLYQILAGGADHAEAAVEKQTEQNRRYHPAQGSASNATVSARETGQGATAHATPRAMPGQVKDYLRNFALGQRAREDRDQSPPTDTKDTGHVDPDRP
ncbi:MAG: hypothetical protein KA179_00060 [Sulfuritalea sp.]|nr:hypothetical protein [Sulfuritalea sp.]